MKNTLDGPWTTFDLHVGILPEEVERFLSEDFQPVNDPDSNERPERFGPADVGNEGCTSWEAWGEPPQVEQGETEVGQHVIIRCESISSAIENFAWLWHEGFTLIPSRDDNPIVGAVSQSVDWAEQYIAFSTHLQHNYPYPVKSEED